MIRCLQETHNKLARGNGKHFIEYRSGLYNEHLSHIRTGDKHHTSDRTFREFLDNCCHYFGCALYMCPLEHLKVIKTKKN